MTQVIDGTKGVLAYFVRQSATSDPGRMSSLYETLPTDIDLLCRMLHQTILHMFWVGESTYGITFGDLRKAGRDICGEFSYETIEERLANVRALDPRPLSEPREVGARTIGCCRDFALMLASILRYQGVPARVRTGIARYFVAPEGPLFEDHYITEVWDEQDARWRQVDAQIDEVQRPAIEHGLDVLDLPAGRFLTGWQLLSGLRDGTIPADQVGFPPVNAGLTYGRNKLFADFVGVTGHELPVHGWWGIGDPRTPEKPGDDRLIDRMIELLQGIDGNDPEALSEALHLTASHERLKRPAGYTPGKYVHPAC